MESGGGGRTSAAPRLKKRVDFSCLHITEFPMSEEAASRDVLYKVPVLVGDPVPLSESLENYGFFCAIGTAHALRDACDLADECGYPVVGRWSVVWDPHQCASFFVPRRDGRRYSDLKGGNACPIRVHRSVAIELLDEDWACFEHFGEVPGPVDRMEHLPGGSLHIEACS